MVSPKRQGVVMKGRPREAPTVPVAAGAAPAGLRVAMRGQVPTVPVAARATSLGRPRDHPCRHRHQLRLLMIQIRHCHRHRHQIQKAKARQSLHGRIEATGAATSAGTLMYEGTESAISDTIRS